MELKYKVGDKVIIQAVVVNTDEEDTELPYEIEFDGFGYWAREGILQKIHCTSVTPQPAAMNNIEVGDIVRILKNVVYTVKTVEVDRVFVEEAIGHVLHKDIESVYKKSWEKPKELQDMSKEELIELVKKLKGE